jgi:hypothetical protein
MGPFMFAHLTAKSGRDTPAQVKSSEIAGVRGIRGPAQAACDGAPRPGGEQFTMVDQKSETYRPRRAFIESDVQPAEPEQPAQSFRGNGWSVPPPANDEDHPKPLYRDETRTNGWSSLASPTAPIPQVDPPREETERPIGPPPRRPRGVDDETTAILPRSRAGQRRTPPPPDAIDDFDRDERGALGQRAKLALLLGAVAVVVVIGLVIGYAVLGADNQPQGNQPPNQPSGAGGSGTSGNGGQSTDKTATALLTDAAMLNPDQAKVLDRDRTWKIGLTQSSPAEDAPTAACFGSEALVGQPTPQQKILRVLESGGKKNPTALHEATAYNSPDEAAQAYAIASRTLGSCAVTGSYIESGHAVSGVGDQAAGVVVIDVSKGQAHSVVLNRTGRVMNVVDAAQPSKALAMLAVAKALGQVNNVQCGAAGGECGGTATVKDGPPPMGGDEPGFLATGDLPPPGAKIAPWVAAPVELPDKEFKGSQCENVNWVTVSAKSKSSRVYLFQESGANFFGLNEIVLTMKDSKASRKQVDKIKSSLTSCKKRVLTASVARPKKVTSIGAQNTKIAGWTAAVSQKSTQGTAKYRVGIVAAGPKVVYTFLNPRGDYDFTSRQWDTVAVRAGERTTQVN